MSHHSQSVKENVKKSHFASSTSRYKESGLTDQKTKLSSKNFDRLMEQRGLSKDKRVALKASTKKGTLMQVRHAKAGEKYVTTHGVQRSSGVFVSKGSLGRTADERINKGALPHLNTAEYETKVELSRDQNLVYGQIGPQTKFSKMDPRQLPRNGGGEQIITDGGYGASAITNKDPKYPIPAQEAFLSKASEVKRQHSPSRSDPESKVSKLSKKGKNNTPSR